MKRILDEPEEFIYGRRLVTAENERIHSGGTTSEEAHEDGVTRDQLCIIVEKTRDRERKKRDRKEEEEKERE